MTADEQPRKQTPSERQHELLMTMAAKPPRAGSESVEVGQQTVGDLKGQHYLKAATFVRGESEDWPQFLGRIEQTTTALAERLTRINGEALRRQLEASAGVNPSGPKAVK